MLPTVISPILAPSAILLLLVHSCYSFPITGNPGTSPDPQVDVIVSTSVCNHVRTLWSIVLSCFVSLAACSWNAVHPNIPGVDEGQWTILSRRFAIMALVVLTPEVLLVWALQQFTNAGMAAQVFNEWRTTSGMGRYFEEWNRTHGFFAGMGGFQLYVDGVSYGPLTVRELIYCIDQGLVGLPIIKEADILDRSKTDGFNKAFVVSQLLWFVFQFIVRVVYHLPPTLLEVETLGLVILSFVTWGLWWKKPKDVSTPCRVNWMSNEHPGAWELELRIATGNDSICHVFYSLASAARLNDTTLVPFSAVKARRVPTLYSGCVGQQVVDNKQDRNAIVLLAGTAVGFGAVHLFSLSYPFASQADYWIWLLCTAVIIAMPTGIFSLACLWSLRDLITPRRFHWDSLRALVRFDSVIYIVIRVTFVVLIILSFRSLPDGVYDVVCWTTPIPHLFS
ncbi:hypothetical protein PAXINDRAFT_99030 [Paxillus involutus ATCC 200175]|nr:hypothetical protein PAXINDRAFT_99030 [Paxillus involutus ATCC 200175]